MKRESRETKNENLLPKIEPMPGAVCAQMVRCGKPNCKCAKGDLHGPYHYRFFYVGGRLHKTYIKKGDFQALRRAVFTYKRQQAERRKSYRDAKSLARELRESNQELSKLLGEYLNALRSI